MKYILVIAAVLAGNSATVDPRLELLTTAFDSRAECEATKRTATGEGKGEIDGRKVLRIVGQCQELDASGVQELKDALNR